MDKPTKPTKVNALVAEERKKVCEHAHVRYRGEIPNTGPVICTMCNTTWDTMEEAKP